MAGRLTIVPTPIGNMGDITLRALDSLREADTVCAEDTRVTKKLLAALGLKEKHLERLDENVIGQRAAHIAYRVQQGEHIAYCTDAGMPGISDPGLRLVAEMRKSAPSATLEVLPGATAVATAFVASGTTSTTFFFGGFLPRKKSARVSLLEKLHSLDAALIFYESPNRIVATLEVISQVFPERDVAVCRELTKLHEEVIRAKTSVIAQEFAVRESIKGEIVVVIDPPSTDESAVDKKVVYERAQLLANAGKHSKSIAQRLSTEFNLSRNEAYKIALSVTVSSDICVLQSHDSDTVHK